MAKCFQLDNFCHMLISVCGSGILKQKCMSLVMDLNLLSLRRDCAVSNLDNLHLIPSVVRGGWWWWCLALFLIWISVSEIIDVHVFTSVHVCGGVCVCVKGRYPPASWLILLMASSKTRREAEKHGVRERARKMESCDAALWWLHSKISKERLKLNLRVYVVLWVFATPWVLPGIVFERSCLHTLWFSIPVSIINQFTEYCCCLVASQLRYNYKKGIKRCICQLISPLRPD